MSVEASIKSVVRDILDFPKPGIVFKDITPIMLNPQVSEEVLDYLVDKYNDAGLDAIAGVESRGFLFGFPLAMRLGLPFVLIRKEGKLPYKKISHSYELEYGTATVEMHVDAVKSGQKVLIHDDLLATGGSALAAAHLIQKCGAEVAGFNFIIGLEFLGGEEKLCSVSNNIVTLAYY
jgi:adenine phosphoribosyltransferase